MPQSVLPSYAILLLTIFTISSNLQITFSQVLQTDTNFNLSSVTEQNSYEEINNTNSNFTTDQPPPQETDEEFLARLEEFIYPKTWTWVMVGLHSVVFVIGLVGNTLVCVAVYRNQSMRTVTNYFIVNLAVADFLVILLCLPPSVIWDVTMTWFFGVVMCKTVLYLQTVSVTVSILTLTFISIDRWYAICFPLKFKSTTGRAKTAIGIIWLFALLLDIPELVVYSTVRKVKLQIDTVYFTQCEATWSNEMNQAWTIFKMTVLYAIPLMFMTFAYSQIIRVLWKSGNNRQHSLDISYGRQVNTFTMNANSGTEGQLRSRRKAAKMLVAVVAMFAVCYLPIHILSLLRLVMILKNTDPNRAFSLISLWLCYANSAINPLIYNFMSGKFRKEFRRAFEHCCRSPPHKDIRYQLSSTLRSHTDRDSKMGTRSSKLSELRRLVSVSTKTRRQSERTIVTKLDA